ERSERAAHVAGEADLYVDREPGGAQGLGVLVQLLPVPVLLAVAGALQVSHSDEVGEDQLVDSPGSEIGCALQQGTLGSEIDSDEGFAKHAQGSSRGVVRPKPGGVRLAAPESIARLPPWSECRPRGRRARRSRRLGSTSRDRTPSRWSW